jgi:hypothetical protein
MQSFLQFFEEKEGKKPEKKGYDYSSVLYLLPDKVGKKIYDWGVENVDDDDIWHKPDDPSFGREDEMHCTVIYGIHDKRSAKTRELLEGVEPFEIKLGKVTAFTVAPDFDVLKVDVTGAALHTLHHLIRDNLECTINHPEYKPHVTIAYMKKGKANKHVGVDKFQGMSMLVNRLVFSSSLGIKTPMTISS